MLLEAASDRMRFARTLGKRLRSWRLRTRNSKVAKLLLSLLLLTVVGLGIWRMLRPDGWVTLVEPESFEEAAGKVHPEEFDAVRAGDKVMLAQLRQLKHDPIRNISYYPVPGDRPDVFPGVDSEHLHGRIGLDEDGKPLWTPIKPFFKMTGEQKREAHMGYCFNTKVCASLPLDRVVPEFNSRKCLDVDYDSMDLEKADIVIVFHNEDFSALIRSLHSILNRTPPKYLGDIILVNDDSNATSHPWLFDDLPRHVNALPKTKLIHLTSRRGLMMARMEGTRLATQPITVYLDSHIEATHRWLQPMLYEIGKDYKRIVTPLIHSIDADNFEFQPGAVGVVGVSWTLGQSHPPQENKDFEPMKSPIMAGGLFGASRKWFMDELGGYDPEMKLYGGEEIEIGFKTWQCGGSIYTLPCSRVGHIFRTDKFWKGQVYKVPFEEIIRNKRRTAEVWMDEYKEVAYLAMSELPANMTLGPLDEVKAVRERLKCKPFKWFLDNVQPDLWAPDPKTDYMGSLNNPKLKGCLDSLGSRQAGPIGAYPCHGQHGSQAFSLTKSGQMRSAESSFASCVVADKNGGLALDHRCKDVKGDWRFQPIATALNYQVRGYKRSEGPSVPVGLMRIGDRCLGVKAEATPKSPYSLFTAACDEDNQQLRWAWEKGPSDL